MKALYALADYPMPLGIAPPGAKVMTVALAPGAQYIPPPGLELRDDDGSPEWQPPAPPVLVPDQVANADARRVMQRRFVPDGRSFYTVVQTYLQEQVTATAPLPDSDPRRIAALGAWTQWDMGNFFLRQDPLVEGMAEVIRTYGGTVDLDEMFLAASVL